MIDIDKWQEIFSSLGRHKLRTFLTAFAVWWGIFMLVILLGAGTGLENSQKRNFNDDAMNSIFIRPGQTSQEYKGLPPGRFIQFNNKDFDLVSELEGIEHITGRFYFWGSFFVTYQGESLSFDVRCVHPDHKVIENTTITEGRYLNQADIDDFRKVCVIGDLVAESFFKNGENPIGKNLTIRNTKYKIVGIFTDSGSDRERRYIYLPISTAQKISGRDRIHQLMVELGDIPLEESQKIEREIKEVLAVQHKFSPDDREAIRTFNLAEAFQEFQTVFSFISGFIWFVGIGSIIAGVIGVSNIMLIVVKERTKEIGVRKALGATPRSIVTMIVQESIFLTSIAGYLGLACGLLIVGGIQSVMESNDIDIEFFYNPEIDLGMVLLALFILILSGAVAGLIPALQAVKINPVIAMKS